MVPAVNVPPDASLSVKIASEKRPRPGSRSRGQEEPTSRAVVAVDVALRHPRSISIYSRSLRCRPGRGAAVIRHSVHDALSILAASRAALPSRTPVVTNETVCTRSRYLVTVVYLDDLRRLGPSRARDAAGPPFARVRHPWRDGPDPQPGRPSSSSRRAPGRSSRDVLQPLEAEFERAGGRRPARLGRPHPRGGHRGPAARRLAPARGRRPGLDGPRAGPRPRAARPGRPAACGRTSRAPTTS